MAHLHPTRAADLTVPAASTVAVGVEMTASGRGRDRAASSATASSGAARLSRWRCWRLALLAVSPVLTPVRDPCRCDAAATERRGDELVGALAVNTSRIGSHSMTVNTDSVSGDCQ
jgi:hypothetical protein